MQQPGEPSVEEILESIKKVIAREGSALPVRHDRPALEPVEPAAADEAEDVLDLEDVSAMAAAEALGDDNPDEADDFHHEADYDEDTPLTGASTATAMRENLAALAMMAKPGRAPQIVRSGETSLEGLTRELLRPMLAQWLDANLPGMVEELVKAEIARIAGKRN